MAVFRFITLWFILFLLTGIIVENLEERKEEPLIILAHDNSESVIMNKDSDYYRNEYPELLEKLSGSLKEDYEVIDYSFTDVSEKDCSMTIPEK